MALPPGPRLPALLQSVLMVGAPLAFLERCRRRFGDVFTIRAAGMGEFVVVASPEAVRAVFTAPPEVLLAGVANAPLGPLVGARSVLLLDGPEHLRHRKLLLPPFHGARMRAWEAAISRATLREVESWPVGRPFSLLEPMQAITLEVIVGAVFGVDDPGRHAELSERVRAVLEPMSSGLRVMLSVLTSGRVGDGGSTRRFAERLAAVDELIYAEIAARRAQGALEGHDDVLSLLLVARDEAGRPLSDEEVRDELVTVLVAGHETTATALAWAFERLLRHPGAVDEIRRSQAAGETDYLEAVVDEVLRLRPILSSVGRVAARPWTLGEWTLPAGTNVLPSIVLLHRRAESFPRPRSFRPERFLGGRARRDGYAWIPFGGGTRRCLGASFAQFEMRIVIGTVLGACALEAVPRRAEKVVRRGITLSPGRRARVIQRRAPDLRREGASARMAPSAQPAPTAVAQAAPTDAAQAAPFVAR